MDRCRRHLFSRSFGFSVKQVHMETTEKRSRISQLFYRERRTCIQRCRKAIAGGLICPSTAAKSNQTSAISFHSSCIFGRIDDIHGNDSCLIAEHYRRCWLFIDAQAKWPPNRIVIHHHRIPIHVRITNSVGSFAMHQIVFPTTLRVATRSFRLLMKMDRTESYLINHWFILCVAQFTKSVPFIRKPITGVATSVSVSLFAESMSTMFVPITSVDLLVRW